MCNINPHFNINCGININDALPLGGDDDYFYIYTVSKRKGNRNKDR